MGTIPQEAVDMDQTCPVEGTASRAWYFTGHLNGEPPLMPDMLSGITESFYVN